MQLTDTHCHIHEALEGANLDTETPKRYKKAGLPNPDNIIKEARAAGVTRMVCVGTTVEDSELAVEFVQKREGLWASAGIHPHEAKVYAGDKKALDRFSILVNKPKVVAVGECGLDFYYSHSTKAQQKKILRFQIELALDHNLPLIFHIREAFKDFWPIFDEYKNIRGVVHSFSAGQKELDAILKRGLYVGLNGIMTFTKDKSQLAAAKIIPLEKLLLETDAPFRISSQPTVTVPGVYRALRSSRSV